VVANKGTAIVQDPLEAESSIMPKAAMQSAAVHHVMRLKEIKKFLLQLHIKN
jgi:chemotaxis response regulator CheB